MLPDNQFYNQWADNQLKDPQREVILKWKSINLANLFLRNLKEQSVQTICEIGGGEGIVLNSIGQMLNADKLVNYELSSRFCEVGQRTYADIQFKNTEFGLDDDLYDIIILSDIVEHVEDENKLLEAVSKRCRFALFKMPIETCLVDTDLFYLLRGMTRPHDHRYGPEHYNGHLRGYTVSKAFSSIGKFFTVLDHQLSDTLDFYGTRNQIRIKNLFGTKIIIWLFGGALFVLGGKK
jgi:hypothetical protein